MHTPFVIIRARALALALAGIAAMAYVAAVAEPIRPVTFVPAANVAAAFAKGMPLVETDRYKIHASRREAPGLAEVHVSDTDIIYVLEGTATIVTGGTIADGKTIAAGEIRGAAIRGGTEQQLSKGDVFVVPNNVPHRFTQVSAPFLYYVVKATDAGGGVR
jgi:mannose-6-phosphate isomerase-like protein (cupin superfamily)